MDWQFEGLLAPRTADGGAVRPTTSVASRAAAAGIPRSAFEGLEAMDTDADTDADSYLGHDDDGSVPNSSERERDPMTLTVSPHATAQFRDPMATFTRKGAAWAGAATHSLGNSAPQDDVLVDVYYKTPSLWQTGVAGALGLVVGGLLNKYPQGEDAQLWLGLVGWLLIRSLECLTLPLVFTSVTICTCNLVVSTKTRPVLTRLAGLFLLAALLASCVALIMAFCFAGSFAHEAAPSEATASFQFVLQCPNGAYLAADGLCTATQERDGQVLTAANVTGLPDALQRSLAEASGVVPDSQSFASQVALLFATAFPENITLAFATAQLLGVTIFSMLLGVGIMAVYDPASGEPNHALVLVRQVHVVLELVLNWLVPYIPLGTLSMTIFSVATGQLSQLELQRSLYLVLAVAMALLAHFAAVACTAYMLIVRRNPLQFLWFLTPGAVFVVATGNVLAAIPVLMRGLEKSRQVSRTLAQFTVVLGNTVCLCGTAVFFVVTPVFMAYVSGQGDLLTPGRLVALVLLATISSVGTPQAPGSALVVMCTLWRTLFASQVPGSFACVVAGEWLLLRLRRVYNVLAVAFIARIVAEQLDETVEDEDDRAYLDQQLGVSFGPR